MNRASERCVLGGMLITGLMAVCFLLVEVIVGTIVMVCAYGVCWTIWCVLAKEY
jgi:hypothetical protein